MICNASPRTNEWLRFAVLRHQGQEEVQDHYDIALEIVIDEDPEKLTLDKMETQDDLDGDSLSILGDSMMIRGKYLNYEGPMRGNRGFVKRTDNGLYMLREDDKIIFRGSLLKGTYKFTGEDPLILQRVSSLS